MATISRVTEVYRGVGAFELMFDGLPQDLVDQLEPFGHIVITEAWQDEPLGDHIMDTARYTGLVDFHSRASGDYDFALRGMGIEWWLGTPDKAGDVLENAVAIGPDANFDDAIRQLLPDSIAEGTLTNTGLPTYTGTHQYVTRREAIDYVCDTVGAVWKINPNGTLDAGPADDVFGATPTGIIVKRVQDSGDDMTLRAFPGPAKSSINAEDYASRVVVLGELEEETVVTGSAELDPEDVPYLDLFGNPMVVTRFISEASTQGVNADARAAAHLAQISTPRTEINYDTGNYDMRGTFTPGGKVWVYDPEAGIQDDANEVTFRGQRINPVLEQVTSVDWPVTAGMGVYYRSRAGEWIDLTRWVDPLDGQTNLSNVEIGRPNRPLLPGSGGSAVGRVPTPDTSVPGVPSFTTPFDQQVSESDTGVPRVEMFVEWTAPPSNTDLTPFTDGSHYEIRFRVAPGGVGTWTQAGLHTWDDLITWDNLLPQSGATDWSSRFIAIDSLSTLIYDLVPGSRYEFQIRAVDTASPPNAGAWSDSYFQYAADDQSPPATPAAPEVAGSLVQISVLHRLGDDGGGTFNLALDLARLDVHVGGDENFTVGAASLVGSIEATSAQIIGKIPVLKSFPADTTDPVWVRVVAVDRAGNQSGPSAASTVTAQLIDAQWVSSLRAEVIESSTLTSTLVNAGEVTSGPDGTPRYRLTGAGLTFEDAEGNITIRLDRATASATLTGTVQTGTTGRRVVMSGSANEVRFYPEVSETRFGRLYSYVPSNFPNDVVVEIRSIDTEDDPSVGIARLFVLPGRAALVNSPDGNTGEVVSRGAVEVTSTRAALSYDDLSGVTAPYEEADTNQVAIVVADDNGVDCECQAAAVRDGGYMALRTTASGLSSEIGRQENGASSTFVRFTSTSDDIDMFHLGDAGLSVRVDDTTVWEDLRASTYQGLGASTRATIRSSQLDGGGNLEAGPDVVLHFSGGGLGFYPAGGGSAYKTFVIDHPAKPDRYLVHATTESPHAGVEYWGVATVEDGEVVVELPDYFESLTELDGRSVQVTVLAEDDPTDRLSLPRRRPREQPVTPSTRPPVDAARLRRPDGKPTPQDAMVYPNPGLPAQVHATYPRDGRFTIYGVGPVETFRVYWLVKAVRKDVRQFDVEPMKATTVVRGDGPYRYITS